MNENDDTIKIIPLLKELEDLMNSAGKMPLTNKGVVDIDYACEIIKDIRVNLPHDIRQAQWLNEEKEHILNDARREYNRLITEANEQVEYLVNNNNILREVQKKAQEIESKTKFSTDYMKYKSYEYIDQLLYDMQNDIADLAINYMQPMTESFNKIMSDLNARVNQSRQEMRTLAERVQPAEDAPGDVPAQE